MATATARIEFRVSPELKSRIEGAAAIENTTTSDFVIAAVTERADDVFRHQGTYTRVPAEFFDDLIASLDEPAETNPALVKAIRRSRIRGARF